MSICLCDCAHHRACLLMSILRLCNCDAHKSQHLDVSLYSIRTFMHPYTRAYQCLCSRVHTQRSCMHAYIHPQVSSMHYALPACPAAPKVYPNIEHSQILSDDCDAHAHRSVCAAPRSTLTEYFSVAIQMASAAAIAP